ncbi:hypothetical protein ZWY2020_054303 [Hordeum vulgare]|nr:hypothetical protein ZWY2020_054303 [Hordeum vulgare]
MGGDGSSSDEAGLLPRFPLVICKDCKICRVRHYVSRTPENYLRHFYKWTNHGSWKGACDMWKWEDAYEEFLQNGCQDVQDHSVGSSSMGRSYAVKEKKEGMMKMKNHVVTAVREEEEAFRSAAAVGHTLLPLRGCIFSDHLTPVLAYRCRVREDDREAPNFLFESVEQGTNVGRYSVLGAQPAMEIVAKANRVTVMDHEMRTKKEQNRDLLILHCQ